jgi:hypothetical protein
LRYLVNNQKVQNIESILEVTVYMIQGRWSDGMGTMMQTLRARGVDVTCDERWAP